MTVDEALEFVRDLVLNVHYEKSYPELKQKMEDAGFEWVPAATTSGAAYDLEKRRWRVDPAKLAGVIEEADSDPYAMEAIKLIARHHLEDYVVLPPSLARCVVDWIDNPPKRKKIGRPENAARDEFIAMLVRYLRDNADVAPTRRRYSDHQKSGCDLVVEVYREAGRSLTYDIALQAWRKHGTRSGK